MRFTKSRSFAFSVLVLCACMGGCISSDSMNGRETLGFGYMRIREGKHDGSVAAGSSSARDTRLSDETIQSLFEGGAK